MGWTEATGRVSKPIRGVAWNHVLGKKDSTKSFVTEVEADAWWRQRETELTGVYESAGVDKPRQQRNVPTLAEFGRFYLPMRDREDRTHDQNLNVFNTMIRQFWGENVKVIDVSKIDVLAMLQMRRPARTANVARAARADGGISWSSSVPCSRARSSMATGRTIRPVRCRRRMCRTASSISAR